MHVFITSRILHKIITFENILHVREIMQLGNVIALYNFNCN